MRQVVRLVIFGLLLAGSAFAADGRIGPAATDAAAPVTAVLFAPAHPVFLRVQIEIDGQSIGRFRERAVARWFGQLDRNHDGFLDKQEIADFLKAFGEQSPAGPRLTLQDADRDPADGKVSPREFRAFVERQLGPPLALSVRKESGSEVDASLFRHLDLNGDGVLTVDELRHAKEALAPLDADDDETISTAELMAASQKVAAAAPASGPRPPEADRLPFMVLGPDTPAESIAQALIREYRIREYGAASKAGDRRVPAAALGLSPEISRRLEAVRNAALGVAELAQLVIEVPPQLQLSIQLFDQRYGRPRVAVTAAEAPPPFRWQQASGDSGTLTVNGLKVALAARRTRGSTGDMSSFYALRFNIVDRDKNGYLDKREFAALGLPEADFAAVDANGDGQITAAELAGYLKGKSNVYVNQVLLAVSDESQSLFEFLDTRADGRLSPRELNAAAARLAALDRNHDGSLTLGELRTQIRLEAEVKRPAAARQLFLLPRQRNDSTSPVSPDRGPEWFRRMDRNYDGDVSWREFLGSRAAFDRLDADHDGLLSPEEAEKAK